MSNLPADHDLSLRDLPDEALLGLIQGTEGEASARRAASQLLKRYQRQVYLWCHRHLRDHERALDLSQEVLLAAYRGLSGFDGRSSVSTWLYVIARNRCLNEMARPGLLFEPELEPDEYGSSGEDPEQALLDQEDEEAVLSLIREHLDPTEQKALWLRCFERMPVGAIGTALHLQDKSGARAVLQRARRKLRTALVERENEEGGQEWTGTAS